MTPVYFIAAVLAAGAVADYFRPQAREQRAQLRAAGVRQWWRVGLFD